MIDVFKVGVHIGMSTNSSQILAIMLKELTGIEMSAGRVEKMLGQMKAAAIGAAQVFIGWEALKTMTHLLEKGIAFNQELAKMKMANFAPGDIRALEAQSYATMNAVPGTNLVDALKGLTDLRNVSGLAEHAVKLSETMARVNAVLANVSGAPAEAAGFKFVKFLEDSGRMMGADGKFSEERVAQQARWMEAVISATNGRVTGDSLFQFRQSGKAAVNTLSDQGLTNLIPAIYSLGAVPVGTGIQGLQTQLLGATQLFGHTIAWMEGHGLLDPSKVHKEKGGRYSLSPGALLGEGELQHDAQGWIWDVFSKHMKYETGPNKGQEMSIADKIDDLRRSGLLRPAQGLISESIQNEVTQRKEIGNIGRAGQVDQYDVMNQESPTFRIMKFQEAWENLQIAIGKSVDVTQFLVPLTNALNALNAAAVAHPEAVKDLMEIAGAIAALTALSGGIKLFTIAIGPFYSGLKLLVGLSGSAAGGSLAATGNGLTILAGGLLKLAGPLGTIIAVVQETMKWASAPMGPDNHLHDGKWGWGDTIHPNVAGPRSSLPDLNEYLPGGSKSHNQPWSGKTYGPNGNTNPDGSQKQSSLDGPMVVHIANASDIANAITGGLAHGTSRPMSGPSGEDYRYDLPSPGFAIG